MPSTSKKPTAEHYAQASQWVSLLHDRDCSQKQKQEFQAWLSISPLHWQAYQEVEAFWRQMDGLETLAKPQLEEARTFVKQAQVKRRWLRRHALALAASILLLAISYPLVRMYLDNGTYRTAKGEHLLVKLSDGSRIDLNTDTELEVAYTFFFRKARLGRGEALFSVKHDGNKPFEVAAAEGLIRDIGTQFNVYKQADKVAVTVLEGEVSVTGKGSGTAQKLSAGMQLTYNNTGANQLADTADTNAIAAWREGRIIFKGQRLDSVLQQLARYHDFKLSVAHSGLASLKVSGSFPIGDLKLALNTIAASLPVKISRQNAGSIILVPAGKKQ
jgi:transmembrane sensor